MKLTTCNTRAKNPHRFSTATDPQILTLPGPSWINQATETAEKSNLAAV